MTALPIAFSDAFAAKNQLLELGYRDDPFSAVNDLEMHSADQNADVAIVVSGDGAITSLSTRNFGLAVTIVETTPSSQSSRAYPVYRTHQRRSRLRTSRIPHGWWAMGEADEASADANTVTRPHGNDELEQLLRDLGRIRDGWDGPNSRAPNAQSLQDMLSLMSCGVPGIKRPDAEVDSGTGSVTLRWSGPAWTESFSLIFVGNGSVTGNLRSAASRKPAWRIAALAKKQLAAKLADPDIMKLISNS